MPLIVTPSFDPHKVKPAEVTSNIGKAVYEGQKQKTYHVDAIDLQREMFKQLPKKLDEVIASHKDYADEYYIVIENQKFRLLQNAIRQFIVVRKSRPLPHYDMSLFKYNNKTQQLTYEWTIPDLETTELMYDNRASVPNSEKQLLEFVIRFKEGTLT